MDTMNVALPTIEQLEKLPLRAVVAYAARNARRLSSELRGIVAEEVLENVLKLVESVSTTDPIGDVDKPSVIRAPVRIAGAYEDAPDGLKSLKRLRIVFAICHAGSAAAFALMAAADSVNARFKRKVAAEEAQLTVRPIEVLRRKAAYAATQAARQDYDLIAAIWRTRGCCRRPTSSLL
jgi:hypothetical protein